MRHFLVRGLVKQKDGSHRMETHVRAVPPGVDHKTMRLPGRAAREMSREPGEHERPKGTGWELDAEAKAQAEENARLERMSRAEFAAYLLEQSRAS
jgi:hypothetical protein